MTRKYLILFVVLSLCFFSLISSLLGERGFIANNMLKRQLSDNEYELDRKAVELEILKLQELELSTEDGLRSAAMNLGYQVESDNVYFFATPDDPIKIQDVQPRKDLSHGPSGFEAWKTGKCLLISLLTSFIITLILWVLRRVHDGETDNDPEQEESGSTGDDSDNNQGRWGSDPSV